jgi:hypothetical protein
MDNYSMKQTTAPCAGTPIPINFYKQPSFDSSGKPQHYLALKPGIDKEPGK